MIATTRPEMSVSEPTLYVAFELGKKDWKLAMTSGFGVAPWLRTVAERRSARRWSGADRQARGSGSGCRRTRAVVSCYEAGRDGFWIHRALTQLGLANRVVDSASIEVNRRARRAKTDRLDALKLVHDAGAGLCAASAACGARCGCRRWRRRRRARSVASGRR